MNLHWNRLYSKDLPEYILVPSSHHYSTIVHPEVCDSTKQCFFITSSWGLQWSNVPQTVNLKVIPASTATLSGSVWLITGKLISAQSHKLIVLYTQKHISRNIQASSARCRISNDVAAREYMRREAHGFPCEANCYCCSWIRYTVWYSFAAAICIRNKPYSVS
jgi:hypothetical protein